MRMSVIATLSAAFLASAGFADDRSEHRSLERGADRFVSGGSAYVDQPVKGDLIAAGGQLRVAGPVGGDLVLAGGSLRLEGTVDQDAYVAGGQIDVDGTVARNARIAGGSIALGPKARIGGNASLAGGRVETRGSIGGYLQVGAGSVLIDGPVQGDVDAGTGELEIGPQARIAGKLRYTSGKPAKIDPEAQVRGGIERVEPPRRAHGGRRTFRAGFAIWTIGLMILAALLAWLLPGFAARVAETARRRFGWSLLAGVVLLIVGPPAIVLLLVTVVGLPLAILGALAYLALLLVGYVAAGVALGNAVAARWRADYAARGAWRAAAAAAGVLVLCLLALVPWLGGFVALVALVAGVGALLLQLRATATAAPAG